MWRVLFLLLLTCTQRLDEDSLTWVKVDCMQCTCSTSAAVHVPGTAEADGTVYCSKCGNKM